MKTKKKRLTIAGVGGYIENLVSRIGIPVLPDASIRQRRYIVFILENVLQNRGNYILSTQHLETMLDFEFAQRMLRK